MKACASRGKHRPRDTLTIPWGASTAQGGSAPSRSQVVSAIAASSLFLKCFRRRDEQPWLKESRGSPRHKNLVCPPPLYRTVVFSGSAIVAWFLFTSLCTSRSAQVDLSCLFLMQKSFPKWSISVTNVPAKHSSAFPPLHLLVKGLLGIGTRGRRAACGRLPRSGAAWEGELHRNHPENLL